MSRIEENFKVIKMAERRTVVVIGAGMSGLVAIKSCLEEDLDVVCFEKTANIGGNWKFRENGLSCMRSTMVNTSKECFAFSDFPFPTQAPNFFMWHQYVQYLESYTDHFHLTSHVLLQHEVVRIEEGPQFKTKGDWKVTINDIKNKKQTEIIAEKLMLCVGVYTKPHYATFPGLATFSGQVIHSSQLKSCQGFEDKNILIAGQGNSAYDAAVELSNVAKNVYCIVRPGVTIVSRMGQNGYPIDLLVLNRFNINKWIRWFSPRKDLENQGAIKFDSDLYGFPKANNKVVNQSISINDRLPYCILNGRIQMRNPIQRFTDNAVIFKGDPTAYKVDVVVMATGYEIPHYSFFQNGELTAKDFQYELYKRVFPFKHQHPTMAIIGATRILSSVSLLAEMQCRWAVMVFNNKTKLPPTAVMEKDIQPNKDTSSETRLPFLMPLPYLDDVAKMIGAKPNFLKMFFADPRLFRACIFGPFVAYQYRLTGPHSWDKARDTILTIPDRVRAGIIGNRGPIKNQSKYVGKANLLVLFTSALITAVRIFCVHHFIKIVLRVRYSFKR